MKEDGQDAKVNAKAKAAAPERASRRAADEKMAVPKTTNNARGASKTASKNKTSAAATGKKEDKAVAAKKPTKTTPAKAPKQSLGKRSLEDENEAAAKKKRVEPKPKPKPAPRAAKIPKATAKAIINQAPTKRLEIFVFGEGGGGELGLGSSESAIDVARPRFNPNLAPDTVGVVQLAPGAMHGIALTHESNILTWGVNDDAALGRRKPDATVDDSDEDTGLSAFDSSPMAITADKFPPGVVFTQIAASDSGGWALTDDGHVFGWGSFRNGEGRKGFWVDDQTHEATQHQWDPVQVPGLKNIKKIAAGANHVLALDTKGAVFAWGISDQGQTGRRPVERRQWDTLKPTPVALPKGNKIVNIFAQGDNSFAIDRDGKVYAWGANSGAQAGIRRNAGQPEACLYKPEIITGIPDAAAMVAGGASHTAVATQSGDVYIWGKATDGMMGFSPLPTADVAQTDSGKGLMLLAPTKMPNLDHVAYISANTRQTIAVTRDGEAYSWGQNDLYEAGQGNSEGTIEVATRMKSKHIDGKKIVIAGAGSGWGYIAAEAGN